MNQSELVANACNRRQTRENVCEQVTIDFGFASDWLRKWRENFNRSNVKPNQVAKELYMIYY